MPLDQGLQDLRAKTLRCINSFSATFDEDPSRYLRAIRFCVSKGFALEEKLAVHMKVSAKQSLAAVKKDKLWSVSKELSKILYSDQHFVQCVLALMTEGLLLGQEPLSKQAITRGTRSSLSAHPLRDLPPGLPQANCKVQALQRVAGALPCCRSRMRPGGPGSGRCLRRGAAGRTGLEAPCRVGNSAALPGICC